MTEVDLSRLLQMIGELYVENQLLKQELDQARQALKATETGG